MKKIHILILLLILGLYTGVGRTTVCNGDYRQEAIQISFIVPFIPTTTDITFGVGKKHFDFEATEYEFKDYDTGKIVHRTSYSGCAYERDYWKQPRFIDLRFWDIPKPSDDRR